MYYYLDVFVNIPIMAISSKNKQDLEVSKFLKKVGLRIRLIREKRGLTLERVEELGYPSWRHLQRVEAGSPSTMTTLFRIAKVLRVSPEEILKGL